MWQHCAILVVAALLARARSIGDVVALCLTLAKASSIILIMLLLMKALQVCLTRTVTAKEAVIAAVGRGGDDALLKVDEAWRADKDVVLAAVLKDGEELLWAAKELKADKDVVLAAVQRTGKALRDAAEALKGDKDVVLAAVSQNGDALDFATPVFRADKDVVMAAVKQDGMAIIYADAALQADKDVVMAAVRQNGDAFHYADEALQADREVVLEALRQNPHGFLNYMRSDLVNDSDFVANLLPELPKGILSPVIRFFNITLLSGKSAFFHAKIPHEYVPEEGQRLLLLRLLTQCALRFGLERQRVLNNADLLDASNCVSDDMSLIALEGGRIHELQLVMKIAT